MSRTARGNQKQMFTSFVEYCGRRNVQAPNNMLTLTKFMNERTFYVDHKHYVGVELDDNMDQT